MAFKAKYRGSCRHCGTAIMIGQLIAGSGGSYSHKDCLPSGSRSADRQYWQGRGDGQRYSDDVKTYGSELANQFAMDDERARYNRGDDY